MAKQQKQANPPEGPQPVGKKGMIAYLGIAIAIGGIFLIRRANQDSEGLSDWLWYTGAAVAAGGALMWFLDGMGREEMMSWFRSGAVAIGVALAIRWSFAEPYRIPSGSMEPTLHGNPDFGKGDRVFVNKWIYGIRFPFMNKRLWHGQSPKRWDIVVFKTVEPNARHGTLVKRVVGLPGEHIQIHDGRVWVNGEALEIPDFLPKGQVYTDPPGAKYGILPNPEYSQVPEGHYLVLGDNSGNSRDGRYFGWLPNENIVGRVACIWWWPQRWRDFTGFSATWWWRSLVTVLAALTLLRILAGRSWPAPNPKGRGIDHYFVSFLAYGLPLPFTRYWLYRWRKPRRGDCVLYAPGDPSLPRDTLLLGRIAGLPGEKIAVRGDQWYMDDSPLETLEGWAGLQGPPAGVPAEYGRSKNKARNEVPAGHYYVFALAPGHEEPALDMDSRSRGWVPEGHVAGKAVARWWPPSRWGAAR